MVIPSDKAYEAYQLRQRGTPWETVVTLTGFSSVKVAQVEVRRYLTELHTYTEREHRLEVLATEMGRLDALQEACWDDAMTGDTKAIDTALRIINTRAKLMGLEELSVGGANITNNTVVVAGNSEEFIRSLKAVST